MPGNANIMGDEQGTHVQWQPPRSVEWGYPAQDEISLMDLWLVLRRRWKTLATVLIACVVMGFVYIFMASPLYRYYVTVQIGQVPRVPRPGIESEPIAPVGQVVARINNSLIPSALQRLFPNGSDAHRRVEYGLKASSPKNSSIVVISGSGTVAQRDTYFDLLNAVTSTLVSNHAAVSDAVHSAYQARLEKAQIKLAALNNSALFRVKLAQQQRKIQAAQDRLAQLKDQQTLLRAQSGRLDVKQKLLASQVGRVQKNIDTVTRSQVAAAHEAGSAADAMTMLLLGNDVQRSRERLASLRTQLQVDLPNERAQLGKALGDNGRLQAQQKSLIGLRGQELHKLKIEHANARANQVQTVRGLKAQLARVHPTRVVLAPIQSSSATGIGSAAVLALSLVLGLLSGIFVALGHEFVVRAQHYEVASQATEPTAEGTSAAIA